MIDDLAKPTNDPARWKAFAEEMDAVLLNIDMDAARRKSSVILTEAEAEAERTKAMAETKKVFLAMQGAQWPLNRTHYTLGHLDAQRLALCCERRLIDWQTAFNAKAAFGTADDVRLMYDQARLLGVNIDLVNPLRYAAKPLLLTPGLRHEGNIETVVQLLKLGADPAQDNGQVYQTAVLEGRADIGRALARHDQSRLLDLNGWVNWARNSRKPKAYEDFRAIWWDYGRFTAADRETLVETKPLGDNTGTLRIIYNFAARRVEEIHEFANPRQNLMNGFTFDEYGEGALEAAREKLIELGGSPSDSGSSLRGKSSVAKPAVFGLGKG